MTTKRKSAPPPPALPAAPAALPEALTKDSPADIAWLLHEAALEYARKRGITAREPHPALEHGWGVPGYRIAVSFRSLLRDLYPAANRLTEEQWHRWTSPVYGFLRASCNAICLEPAAEPPVWWIRVEWQPAIQVPGMPIFRHVSPTKREQRLTAAEAGEDREPGSVLSRFRCSDCGAEFDTPEALNGHATGKHRKTEPVIVCPEPECGGRQIKGAGPYAKHVQWHKERIESGQAAAARAAALDVAFDSLRSSLDKIVRVAVEEATRGLTEDLEKVTAERDALKARLEQVIKALGAGS